MSDFSSETFKELISALQKSSAAMVAVSEKVIVLEKSIEKLEDSISELAGVLKNGRLKEILTAVQAHDSKTDGYPEKCIVEIASVIEKTMQNTMDLTIKSTAFKDAVSTSIKEQLDPTDPGNKIPVYMKQQADRLGWQDWLNGKAFLVGGALFGIVEIIAKFWGK